MTTSPAFLALSGSERLEHEYDLLGELRSRAVEANVSAVSLVERWFLFVSLFKQSQRRFLAMSTEEQGGLLARHRQIVVSMLEEGERFEGCEHRRKDVAMTVEVLRRIYRVWHGPAVETAEADALRAYFYESSGADQAAV